MRLFVLLGGFALLALSHCAFADDAHEPQFDFARFTSVSHQPARTVRWQPSFTSTGGRAINTLQVGNGPRRTLILGSLHGDEPLAVRLVEQLVDDARGHESAWSGLTVLFVRTSNPDGLQRGSRWNARGVDLNRNFPTSGFRPNAQRKTGPAPASERETQFILRLLYAFRPHRVVHVKSTTAKSGWVLYNRPASETSRQLSAAESFHVQELPRNAIIGSLESYVTDVMRIEQLTVALPADDSASASWSRYRGALLAAAGVSSGSDRPKSDDGPPASIANRRRSDPAAQAKRPLNPVPQKGYFELPPPPDFLAKDGM